MNSKIIFDMKEIPKRLYESNYVYKITALIENTVFYSHIARLYCSNFSEEFFLLKSIIDSNLSQTGSCCLLFQVSIETNQNFFSEKVFHTFRMSQIIIQNIKNMLSDTTYADYTFVVKGKEFKVHKNILAESSKIMRRLFESGFKESTTNRSEIKNFESDDFESLLRFMYIGELPKNFNDSCMSLYEVADFYAVEELAHMCIVEMEANLNILNAVEIYELAFLHDTDELMQNLRVKAWRIVR